VYKVAGTSVLNALENATYPGYVPVAVRPSITRLARKFHLSSSFPVRVHSKAKEVKAKLKPAMYENYFKFAFVRNPWDWQVSLYEYSRQHKSHPQKNLMSSFKDFDDYIRWRVKEEGTLQKEFVTDNNGELIVDHIGKFEKLSADFVEICDKIGLAVSLPEFNKTKSRKDYTAYYTDETQRLVAEHFKEDIEMFDYSFGK
ncbi:MAG: sulfotransferase family 2 domain-containing protein, partial [Phormidesmis sp.]